MPRLCNRPPLYRRHKPSGQAIVTLSGRDHYLGPFGTKVSRDEYDRVVGEWLANGRQSPVSAGSNGLCVSELINAFRKHANVYYRRPDGTPSSECTVLRHALRPLRRLYGRTEVTAFGPLSLKAVAEEMTRLGWCRGTINRHLGRIKHVFKWGTTNEMVPVGVYHGLQAVSGLKAGRTKARESEPVRPVAREHVEAVLPFVSPQIGAMIRLQLLTGMRPGEVCAMRSCDIDMSGTLWSYRPEVHKTTHHGHIRSIYLGPRAQEIIKPFLKTDLSAHLFSPTDSEQFRRAKARELRKTPVSQGNSPGTNRKRHPSRKAGSHYNVAAYRRAIARACDRAFPIPDKLKGKDLVDAQARAKVLRKQHRWHPHQLRHSAATGLRKQFGLEAAQVIHGHTTLAVTEIYAEKNVEAAQRVMGEVG